MADDNADKDVRSTLPIRLAAGALTGLLGGLGMYVVLVTVAAWRDLGLAYPLHAVQALMSGARVLPDYPHQVWVRSQNTDAIVGPLCFFLPAVVVGMVTAWRAGRPGTRAPLRPLRVARTAVPVTAALFVVFVVLIAGHEAPLAVQRFSSGAGVRELGLTAWAVSHVAYAVVLVGLLAPVTRLAAGSKHHFPAVSTGTNQSSGGSSPTRPSTASRSRSAWPV